MKRLLLVIFLFLPLIAFTQNNQPGREQIRAKMQQIRQNTNWDDPAAAQKANEEIKKLASQLSGNQGPATAPSGLQQTGAAPLSARTPASTKENVVAIAGRFFDISYKALDAVSKSQFDLDLKAAGEKGFSLEAVRTLSGTGGFYLTFGTDHHIACVYLASAVKEFPTDTLSINNFGAYLRNIDSAAISIPVLLYANQLFSQSPLILTQLGNSYFELNDFVRAESYLKQALMVNPDFSQAHTSLCDLYIKQNRLQDAILELFAGVKGMGFSYRQATNNFSHLKSQAENAEGGETEKEKFWDEIRKQMNPPDPLASLVPETDRLKMPAFGNCSMIADWMEGGGYSSAVQGYQSFHSQLMSFVMDFQKVQNELPDLPPNAVLRDYPNERFALDCIMEYFFKESKDEADDFQEKVDDIIEGIKEDADDYFQNAERILKDYRKCTEGCGTDYYCTEECKRMYCSSECPAANKYNSLLQGHFNDYLKAFNETRDNQKKILEDLYEFTSQWFAKIESQYWSRIYAYEIQRVALTVIGNAYMAYQQPFPAPVHNVCGTDCSLYANPYPIPPEEVKKNTPQANQCPDIGKIKIGFGPCDLGLDCESIEFGCAIGVAGSIKRNFKKNTTTGFIGVGVKGSAGFIGAGGRAGFEVTASDNNEITDVKARFDVSVSLGPGVTKAGFSTTGSYSVMTGPKASAGASFGGKAF
jgi:tetratricopeptide (TPR) repeat protein